MKYLSLDSGKCNGKRACEKACAQTFFKKGEAEYSAIKISNSDMGFTANVCNQCGQCMEICPVKALSRNKIGTVMVDKKICIGCFMCIGFCPTLSMRRAHDQREPHKCVSCGACVKACPNQALHLTEIPNASC